MPEKEVPTRQAVIIGTNYEEAPGTFNELKGAEHDATEIKERLDYSFDIPDEHYLRGKQADYDSIRSAINDVFYNADKNSDCALFYFSGHGYVDFYGNSFIVPHNMKKKDAFVSGITMRELQNVITNYPKGKPGGGRHAIAILDCCYSGEITKGNGEGEEKEPTFITEVKGISGEGVFLLPSSVADEASREIECAHKFGTEEATSEHVHGALTYLLIEGLDHGAVDTPEGTIYVDRLSKYVEDNITGITKQEYKPLINASGMSSVRIAECKQVYIDNINKIIKTAADYIEDDEEYGWSGTPAAIKEISKVLVLNPNNNEAREILAHARENLINYNKMAVSWFQINNKDLKKEFQKIRAYYVYKQLESLVFDTFPRKVDEITKLDDKREILLEYLCRAATDEINLKEFMNRCKSLDNPSSSVAGQEVSPKTDIKEPEKIGKVLKRQKNPDNF